MTLNAYVFSAAGARTHHRPVHDYRHVPERDGRGRSDPLMAKNTADDAAAKAKKQNTVLIVGGVLLLAVAAIQVPKLTKKDAPTEAGSTTTAARVVAIRTRPEESWPSPRPGVG